MINLKFREFNTVFSPFCQTLCNQYPKYYAMCLSRGPIFLAFSFLLFSYCLCADREKVNHGNGTSRFPDRCRHMLVNIHWVDRWHTSVGSKGFICIWFANNDLFFLLTLFTRCDCLIYTHNDTVKQRYLTDASSSSTLQRLVFTGERKQQL